MGRLEDLDLEAVFAFPLQEVGVADLLGGGFAVYDVMFDGSPARRLISRNTRELLRRYAKAGADIRYALLRPGREGEVRVTTDPAHYDEHPGSVELRSPGGLLFPTGPDAPPGATPEEGCRYPTSAPS